MNQLNWIRALAILLASAISARADDLSKAPEQTRQGTIIARLNFVRTINQHWVENHSQLFVTRETYRVSGQSRAECMYFIDEQGQPIVSQIDGSKVQSSGSGSRTYFSLSKGLGSAAFVMENGSESGDLAQAEVPWIGLGDISHAEGTENQMTATVNIPVNMHGNEHTEIAYYVHPFLWMPPHIIHRSDDRIIEARGYGAKMFPASVKPANDSEGWSGAVTSLRKGGGVSVNFSGSHSNTRKSDKVVTHESLSASVMIIPGKPVPVDMQIAPVDQPTYDKYIPSPVSEDDQVKKLFGDGQTIAFTATITPKDPKQTDGAAGVIDFYLQDVSKHKGICGNYPHDASAEKDGLQFAPGGDVTIDPADPKHAYTHSAQFAATVYVKANEAGAYGHLVAQCDDLGVQAICQRTNQPGIDIPRDDNHNHIADDWENQMGVYGKNYDATWDEEDTPQGKNNGDGLTFYEEYRGFIIANPLTGDQMFQRLKPGNKKLFFYVDGADASIYKSGIKTWAVVSGVTPYFVPTLNQLKDDHNDPIHPTWINFNSSTNDGTDFSDKQHAVFVFGRSRADNADPSVDGQTVPIDAGNEGPYTPNDIKYIAVIRPNMEAFIHKQLSLYATTPGPHDQQWMADHGVTKNDFHAVLNNPAQLKNLADEYIGYTTLHELGHATGAEHHGIAQMDADTAANGGQLPPGNTAESYYTSGSTNCPMFYWAIAGRQYVLPFLLGKWDPSTVAWIAGTKPGDFGSPTAWQYCTTDSNDAGKISLHK